MIHDTNNSLETKCYYIKETAEMGRGLYANMHITQGTIIAQCELLVLNTGDTELVNMTQLRHYTFKYDNTNDCLVLGEGELFNHNDNANVSYKLEPITDPLTGKVLRQVMVFRAITDIQVTKQLFIDYNSDTEINTDAYTSAVSLY